MALVNINYRFPNYVDDFGASIPNIPAKFGQDLADTIITGMGYTLRPAAISCGGVAGIFQPRHLIATFENGSVHKFLVNIADVIAKGQFLYAQGAVCVALEGEKWGNVPSNKFPNDTTFRTSPWSNLPDRGIKDAFTFNYTSDVVSGVIKMATNIETLPEALQNCQKAGLADAVKGAGGICKLSASNVVPRKLIIQAIGTKDGDAATRKRIVRRQAKVSKRADLATVGKDIAACAYCLGYEGESIRNLVPYLNINANPAAPPSN